MSGKRSTIVVGNLSLAAFFLLALFFSPFSTGRGYAFFAKLQFKAKIRGHLRLKGYNLYPGIPVAPCTLCAIDRGAAAVAAIPQNSYCLCGLVPRGHADLRPVRVPPGAN